ncbi:unnamed protein product [Caenorhabditis sp. 36 PRJEB53466]|nr:unnamed protein product [Caenorhabditis sp. 36 PRJEB53466]
MSTKLLLLFLAVGVTQFLTSVDGANGRGSIKLGLGLESGKGKGFHGGPSSGHVDEQPEYETEKKLLIREKRAAPAPTGANKTAINPQKTANGTQAKNGNDLALGQKRVAGFVKIFAPLTGCLVFLCLANVGLFIWLSITLKKLRKP